MKIPFLSLKNSNQELESELRSAFNEFLNKGHYILGDSVKSFERNFAEFCEEKYCVGLANGLDALIISLSYFKFKPGSEVIVPANTYYASILAIIKANLIPVLVEPSISDYLIDVSKIREKITKNTVAVLAVNLYGKMCNFNEIGQICDEFHLKLIVDAAQSHGALYGNSKKCLGAQATAYSFYPSKNLGAFADAGALVTSDHELYEFAKKYRNYGSSEKYVFEEKGINSRLSELQAAFLDIKLKHLEIETEYRRKLAKFYLENISNPKLTLPNSRTTESDAWHLFTVRVKDRKSFQKYLLDKGIGTEIHYPIPPHKQKAFANYNDIILPITEQIHTEIISLPLNNALSLEEVTYIAKSINLF